MGLPHPVFQVHPGNGRDIDGDDGAAQRGIGRGPGLGAALCHFTEDVISELAMAALDAVEADVISEFNGGAQPVESGDVGAADALEALGAEGGLVPAFGDDGVPQAVDNLIAHVEKAGAFGRLQPFVRAGGIHVAAEIMNVQPHHAGHVGAIHGRENTF